MRIYYNIFFLEKLTILTIIEVIKNISKYECSQITCPLFKCSSSGMNDNKCLSILQETIMGDTKIIYNLSQCKNKKKCSLISWDSTIGVCVPNIRKSFGGEKCSSDSDCFSQACNNHKICQNKEINEKCSDDKECSREAVCIFDASNGETLSDRTCRPLVKLGEKCILDEADISGFHSNCPAFSVCSNPFSTPDATNGICFEQNSLKIGENSTNFHACQGNNIILLKKGYYVCANVSSTAKACEIARDQSLECTNSIIVGEGQIIDEKEKKIQSQGICRCDVDGNKHCEIIAGPQFDNYINLIRKKTKEKSIVPQNFHVAAFRETFNDQEIAEAYFNYKYDSSKADACAKQYFLDNLLLAFENQIIIKVYLIQYFFIYFLLIN